MLIKQAFNWGKQDRYVEPMNFKMEVSNILECKAYALSEEEKVPVIKNWLGWEGLQLIQTFTQEEKDMHRMAKDLFTVLYYK